MDENERSLPVKTAVAVASFLTLALSGLGLAEQHYIYKTAQGRLVISNKPPPPGSDVLRKLELPEPPDAEAQTRLDTDNQQPDPAKPKSVVETP